MVKKPCWLTILLISTVLLISCNSIENYEDPSEPLFEGSYADSPPQFDGEIDAVTWNIKFSEEVETATAELGDVEELQGLDIILLQEMDEAGVEAIAQAAGYNYVYFPASIHTHHDENFGNAILSSWPISDARKLILPHKNPRNQQLRIAVRAVVTIGNYEVLTYSVHTETLWLSQRKRDAQLDFLVEDIFGDYEHVIVGGDFNTFSQKSIIAVEQRFEQAGLKRVSTGAGYTFEVGSAKFTLDHIFAKGMSVLDNGVYRETEASDHFPLWVKLLVN